MTISIDYIPSLAVGHFVQMTDTFDGDANDPDYDCYEYTWMGLVWEVMQ